MKNFLRNKKGQFTSDGLMGNTFRKGKTPWNKGKKFNLETRMKMSLAKKKNKEHLSIQGYKINFNSLCDGGNQYFKKVHRKNMEKYLGRELKEKEIVHHVNGKRDDNRLNNLVLFRHHSAHTRLHHFCRRHNLNINKYKLSFYAK